MADLFDQTENASRATPTASPANRSRQFAGMSPKELTVLCAAIATFLWGAWVTKSIVSDVAGEPEIVQLQLQSVIGEYLQAQARSDTDEQTAAQETAAFMAVLDETVEGLSDSGKLVLVHEAVIGGDVPDVTDMVKSAVYAKVPRPRVAQATLEAQQAQASRIQDEMQAFMSSGEGRADNGQR